MWIWPWFLSLPHFLTHWTKLRGLKKLWFLSEAEPNWGTLYPPDTASLLTSAVGHWGLCLTPHDKGLHLGPRSELVECLQRWMATNSCHPSRWRSGARGERVGCLPRSHCFWKFCVPQLESHVLGPVLEFSLSLPLGSSSDGVLVLDNPLLQPLSLPSPTPFFLYSHPLPIPSLANTSKGSVFQQGDPRLSDALHILLSEEEGLALPPPAVVV